MTDATEKLSGKCLCGAVRYETRGAPARVINCHCHSCRKHSGAPMATLAVYKAGRVDFSGEPRKLYQSSEGVGRGFCDQCGTSLTFEANLRGYGPLCAVHISAFDDPALLPPDAHSFYPERISWFDAVDDLPRYTGLIVDGELVCRGPLR